jgi:hypothetical protein
VYTVTPRASAGNLCYGDPFVVTAPITPETVISAPDQVICSGETTSIAITNVNGVPASAFNWVVTATNNVSGASDDSGTIIAQTLATVDGINVGTVDYTITPVANGCFGDPIVVTATVNPLPTVSVPADFAVCEPTSIPISGTIGGGASSGLWEVITGNGGLSASSVSGNTVSAVYIPALTDVNTTVVLRLNTDDPDGPSQPCVSVFEEVSIQIDESAKVTAGANQEICEDVSAVLSGNVFGSATSGTWSIVSGGDGTFDDLTSPVTNYNPGPNDRLVGTTVTLRLTTNDPGTTCGATFAETVVKVNKLPEVFLTGLNPIYQEDEPEVILTGFPTTGGTGVFSGPGVFGNQFYPTFADLTPTINTIAYTFTNATTGCSNFASFDVIVNPVSTVDFGIETANLNASDELEICGDNSLNPDGKLKLQGTPDISSSGPLGAFFSSGDNNPVIDDRIQSSGGNVTLDTKGLPSGLYNITYTYFNDFGAKSTRTRFIKVLAPPVPAFTINNFCVDSPISFTESSTVAAGPYGGTNVAWEWTFGDGLSSSDQNPFHVYAEERPDYVVSLTVTTDQGCSQSVVQSDVKIGAVPTVSYIPYNFCTGDITNFEASVVFENLISPPKDFTWDFGDGVIESTNTVNEANHAYLDNGRYNVALTVTTEEDCQVTFARDVDIFKQTPIDPSATDGYLESFEADDGGWKNGAELDSDTSWVWGTPTGTKINMASDGVNAWWTGVNKDDPNEYYYPGENSFVNGPCFDLTNLTRPMISLDTWNDSQVGFDGAVLQYSTNGGQNWEPLGRNVGEGFNWYNRIGILGEPGGESTGWSDSTSGWVSSRYTLEDIPNADRSQVRIRVAFGSNEDNPIGSRLNGFAFDNVNIRERDRVVLVENFTNLENDSYPGVRNYILDKEAQRPEDFVYLNYHIAFPDDSDSLYRDNRSQPQTRANSYGFSQSILTTFDGNQGNDNLPTSWGIPDLDTRTLFDPQFDIDLQLLPVGEDSISVRWDVTATQQVDNPIVVHTLVIEKNILLQDGTIAHNVVKKMLPNPGGSSRTDMLSYAQGEGYSSQLDWAIDVRLYDGSDLAVVVFVQEATDGGRAGEIYQVAIADVPGTKVSPIVTGIDDVLEAVARNINVYPNPVERDLYFSTSDRPGSSFNWRIVDQRGVTLMSDSFNFTNGEYSVDTSEIPNGAYYLIISAADQPLTYEKLLIMHR